MLPTKPIVTVRVIISTLSAYFNILYSEKSRSGEFSREVTNRDQTIRIAPNLYLADTSAQIVLRWWCRSRRSVFAGLSSLFVFLLLSRSSG